MNEDIDEASVDVEETLNELINTLVGAASAAGFVNSLLENIAESITKVRVQRIYVEGIFMSTRSKRLNLI